MQVKTGPPELCSRCSCSCAPWASDLSRLGVPTEGNQSNCLGLRVKAGHATWQEGLLPVPRRRLTPASHPSLPPLAVRLWRSSERSRQAGLRSRPEHGHVLCHRPPAGCRADLCGQNENHGYVLRGSGWRPGGALCPQLSLVSRRPLAGHAGLRPPGSGRLYCLHCPAGLEASCRGGERAVPTGLAKRAEMLRARWAPAAVICGLSGEGGGHGGAPSASTSPGIVTGPQTVPVHFNFKERRTRQKPSSASPSCRKPKQRAQTSLNLDEPPGVCALTLEGGTPSPCLTSSWPNVFFF